LLEPPFIEPDVSALLCIPADRTWMFLLTNELR
jgi:hypothetical protein